MIKLLTSVENINLDLRDYQGKTPLMKVMLKVKLFSLFMLHVYTRYLVVSLGLSNSKVYHNYIFF